MPTGDLRAALRAHGHSLRPLVHIGKGGVTRGVLAQVARTLFDHELVKVRITAECPVDRFAVADELGAQPGTQVVQLLGRIVLVYKRHPQKPRFEGKATREGVGDAATKRAAPSKRLRRPKSSRRSE